MISHNWSPMKRLIWLRGSGITGGSGTYETVTGNPVSFTAKAAPLRQLKVAFSPVQSLNGYDSPWPAGGGANKWDEELEVGGIDDSTGEPAIVPSQRRSINFIPVSPETSYYACTPNVGSGGFWVYCYDESKAFIGRATAGGGGYDVKKTAFTTIANCRFIKFKTQSSTANYNNIAINYPATVTTYSPYSNECPISGWSSLTVEQRGKNLWDEEWELGALNSTTGQDQSDSTHIRSKNYIPVAPSTAYYNKGYTLAIFEYDANKAYLGYHNYIVGTFTTSASTRYLRFYRTATTYSNDISINYPSTDHDYHAYNPSSRSISITLGSTVYSGTVDVVTGVGEINWVKDVYDGSSDEVWGYAINETPAAFYTQISYPANNPQSMGNYLKRVTAFGAVSGFSYIIHSNQIRVSDMGGECADTTSAGAVAKLRAYLAANPFEVVHKITTPIPIQLTPQEVQSLAGDNTMWSAANGDLTVEYRSN